MCDRQLQSYNNTVYQFSAPVTSHRDAGFRFCRGKSLTFDCQHESVVVIQSADVYAVLLKFELLAEFF